MALTERQILEPLYEKLQLRNKKILTKACEYLRILKTKPQQVLLTDKAKSIICLNLAATYLGLSFDVNAAVKLANVKSSIYRHGYSWIEKLLDLDKIATISEACVLFGCTEVQKTAEGLLEMYKADHISQYFEHPQYIASAIYAACRMQKVKCEKKKFVTYSHLKSSQFNELQNQFNKYSDSIKNGSVILKSKHTASSVAASIAEKVLKHRKSSAMQDDDDDDDSEEQQEDYEVWKKRMLDECCAALKK